jgi:hypothetical protein
MRSEARRCKVIWSDVSIMVGGRAKRIQIRDKKSGRDRQLGQPYAMDPKFAYVKTSLAESYRLKITGMSGRPINDGRKRQCSVWAGPCCLATKKA